MVYIEGGYALMSEWTTCNVPSKCMYVIEVPSRLKNEMPILSLFSGPIDAIPHSILYS